MQTSYRTVDGFGQAQVVIEKSVFIGYAKPAAEEAEALAFIQEIRKKHRDATHNVPAYIVGGASRIQRCSDDGEPSGTAGVPVLEVLKKEGLQDVAVVVTRYFGGIKLGTGGLVRAYTKGAKIALEAAGIVTRELYQAVEIALEYSLLGMMQNQLRLQGYEIKGIAYEERVRLQVWVRAETVPQFEAQVIEWTNGRAALRAEEAVYRTGGRG